MKTDPDDLTVRDLLDLKSQQMLVVNPEYQRGSCGLWRRRRGSLTQSSEDTQFL
jgi:hypothetical protein